MDTQQKLLRAAEDQFQRHGFNSTGMDRLAQAASMSSRTLYKHAGSKAALIAAVLAERDQRFFELLDVASVDALFQVLDDWLRKEGRRGCLFLRAFGETGGDLPEVVAAMTEHKLRCLAKIRRLVAQETGKPRGNGALAEQILVLFEGATAASIYRGHDAVTAARRAAAALIAQARA